MCNSQRDYQKEVEEEIKIEKKIEEAEINLRKRKHEDDVRFLYHFLVFLKVFKLAKNLSLGGQASTEKCDEWSWTNRESVKNCWGRNNDAEDVAFFYPKKGWCQATNAGCRCYLRRPKDNNISTEEKAEREGEPTQYKLEARVFRIVSVHSFIFTSLLRFSAISSSLNEICCFSFPLIKITS